MTSCANLKELDLYHAEVKSNEGINGFTSIDIFSTGGTDEVWGNADQECNPLTFSLLDARFDYPYTKDIKNSNKANKLDDGYLTALEVSKLNWQGTELVVISGCESGIGVNKAGDGVYGLKRSIAVSGARSSMLSLWEVKDEPTAAFMESFYKKLKSGVSRNRAY